MSDNSRINKQSSALADEAAARAKARKHQRQVAMSGAAGNLDEYDSTPGDLDFPTGRGEAAREKAKKALHG